MAVEERLAPFFDHPLVAEYLIDLQSDVSDCRDRNRHTHVQDRAEVGQEICEVEAVTLPGAQMKRLEGIVTLPRRHLGTRWPRMSTTLFPSIAQVTRAMRNGIAVFAFRND